MPLYEVTVTRTESITFTLEAASPEDADDRCLSDGDETGSKTISIETDSIIELAAG